MHRLPTATMESEADAFASEFLMPAKDIGPHLEDLTIDRAAYMKPYWRASMAALIFRAKTLRQINAGQYDYLWRQMSGRGWRLHEPVQLERGGDTPGVLTEILSTVLSDWSYSEEELSMMLGLFYGELSELYGLSRKHGLRLVQ